MIIGFSPYSFPPAYTGKTDSFVAEAGWPPLLLAIAIVVINPVNASIPNKINTHKGQQIFVYPSYVLGGSTDESYLEKSFDSLKATVSTTGSPL